MRSIEAIRRGLAVAAVSGLAACATAEPGADLSATDPHEGFNRKVLDASIKFDRYFLRPVAQGYDVVVPTTIKHLVGNGFSHLDLPSDFVSFVLQGEVKPALHVLGRFTINTVLGAGGLLDPATEFGLPEKDTDFGITLGKNGVGEGAYWVAPVIGPTTSRDFTGTVVDIMISPVRSFGLVPPNPPIKVGLGLRLLETTDDRSRHMDLYDELLYESDDPYVTLRSVYLQRRRSAIASEEAGAEALPDIFDTQ